MPYHTVYNNALGNPPLSIWGMHSPLDELYWKEPSKKNYVATPSLKGAGSNLERAGIKAIDLLKQKELFGNPVTIERQP